MPPLLAVRRLCRLPGGRAVHHSKQSLLGGVHLSCWRSVPSFVPGVRQADPADCGVRLRGCGDIWPVYDYLAGHRLQFSGEGGGRPLLWHEPFPDALFRSRGRVCAGAERHAFRSQYPECGQGGVPGGDRWISAPGARSGIFRRKPGARCPDSALLPDSVRPDVVRFPQKEARLCLLRPVLPGPYSHGSRFSVRPVRVSLSARFHLYGKRPCHAVCADGVGSGPQPGRTHSCVEKRRPEGACRQSGLRKKGAGFRRGGSCIHSVHGGGFLLGRIQCGL